MYFARHTECFQRKRNSNWMRSRVTLKSFMMLSVRQHSQ